MRNVARPFELLRAEGEIIDVALSLAHICYIRIHLRHANNSSYPDSSFRFAYMSG